MFKFSLSNLLLLCVSCSLALGWMADRHLLNRRLDALHYKIAQTRSVFTDVRNEWFFQLAECRSSDDEILLDRITNNREVELVSELLTVFRFRHSFSDPVFPKAIANIQLELLDCQSFADFQKKASQLEFELEFLSSDSGVQHRNFAKYINDSIGLGGVEQK